MSPDALETLIHDVHSQGASLISAAPLLRESSPSETRELLALMIQQAESLAVKLAAFRRSLGK
jgi:hypothetical protein